MEEEPRKVCAMQRKQRVQKTSGLEMNGVSSAGFWCFETEKRESTFLANALRYPK